MFKFPSSRNTAQALLEYLLINLATLLILLQAFDLSITALKAAPLVYSGDGLDMLKRFKLLYSGEWSIFGIAQSQQLGAPFGYDGGDFAQPIAGQLLVQKLFTLLAGGPIYGFNLFVVSSYFLATSAMHWTLRRLGVPVAISAALALLFAFQPFHYLRIHHTNYIQYFFIPVLLVFMLDIWKDTPLFFKRNPDNQKIIFSNTVSTWLKLAVIAFFALWNFYYSFFLAALCLTAMLSAYAHTRHTSNLLSGLLMLAALTVPVALNYLPYALYKQEHGKNEAVAQRQPQDALTFGLKISDMAMPVHQHRLHSFRELREEYSKTAPLLNETTSSSIGLIATAGLFGLFIALIIPCQKLIRRMAILNVTSILLATVGGGGSIIAYTIFSQIRGYNRISIIIATLALLAIGVFLKELNSGRNFRSQVLAILLGSTLLLGLADQIPPHLSMRPSPSTTNQYASDRLFVGQIEEAQSNKSKNIMQLPYICSPECIGANKIDGYSHLIGYIHGTDIQWSYGAAKGRISDRWYSRIANSGNTESMIKALQHSGFSGIYIDRRGYTDRAQKLEAELFRLTKQSPTISPDKNKSFFPLKPVNDHPELFNEVLGDGFYGWEGPFGKFTWAKQKAVLHYAQLSEMPRDYTIQFTLNTLLPRTLIIDGAKKAKIYKLSPEHTTQVSLRVTPETRSDVITLYSPEPARRPGNGDPRELGFALSNLQIIEEDTGRDLVKLSGEILK